MELKTMEENEDKPIALDFYEEIGEAFSRGVDNKPHNAFLDKPTVTEMILDVKNKNVLDAGCGSGVYTEWLVNKGAEVTGIDISPTMLKFAKERVGKKAKLMEFDLAKPLNFLIDEEFDGIVSGLALSYIKDWFSMFKEFNRILKPNGWIVFSTDHPGNYWLRQYTNNYFEIEYIEGSVRDPNNSTKRILMPHYRRSLNQMLEPIEANQFKLDKIKESFPTEEFRKVDPEDYAKVSTEPSFICFRIFKI